MQRYFIKFSYIGTEYRGLQKNIFQSEHIIHDTDTIQGALECAFSVLRPKCTVWPKISTSSRTDTGVHALCNTAHVDIQNSCNGIYNPSIVCKDVNRYLTKCRHDIRLLEFVPVKETFHARHVATQRKYIYRFMIPKVSTNHQLPLIEKSHTHCFRDKNFDIERMKRGARLFLGTKDFKTFSASPKTKTNLLYRRTIDEFTVEKSHPLMPMDPLSQNYEFWQVLCSSRSFLYNQVRRMVTALLHLGAGYITERDINCMLQVPNHQNWIRHLPLVPPSGLHLINVEYSQETLDKYIIKCKPTTPNNPIVKPIDLDET
ncbi:tRNA pseudouridine synthase-like 1 isoform X2 [Nomia melanderi]|uniref:tRNA pseudouridine synthase-like 1 isoform X2 n=1 Tax=Nomia melanderi TaxID=2448451 RepID=UPI003FCEDF29